MTLVLEFVPWLRLGLNSAVPGLSQGDSCSLKPPQEGSAPEPSCSGACSVAEVLSSQFLSPLVQSFIGIKNAGRLLHFSEIGK